MRMKKMNRGWPFSDENEMQEIKAVWRAIHGGEELGIK